VYGHKSTLYGMARSAMFRVGENGLDDSYRNLLLTIIEK
jgi:hypothetical protein